jgi:alpha-D-ribose 1-methylphosphonate 5-triphosphate diphosphatase PhnM
VFNLEALTARLQLFGLPQQRQQPRPVALVLASHLAHHQLAVTTRNDVLGSQLLKRVLQQHQSQQEQQQQQRQVLCEYLAHYELAVATHHDVTSSQLLKRVLRQQQQK